MQHVTRVKTHDLVIKLIDDRLILSLSRILREILNSLGPKEMTCKIIADEILIVLN